MAHLSSNKESLHFQAPANLSRIKVCAASGKLPSDACNEELVYPEYFLPGTLPKVTCDECSRVKNQRQQGLSNFSSDIGIFGDMDFSGSSIEVDEDLLLDDNSLFDDDGGYDFEDEDAEPLIPNEPTESESVVEPVKVKEEVIKKVEEVQTVISENDAEEAETENVTVEMPVEKIDDSITEVQTNKDVETPLVTDATSDN